MKCVLSTRPQTRGVRCSVNLRWVLAITSQRSACMVQEYVSVPRPCTLRHIRSVSMLWPSSGPAETSLSICLTLAGSWRCMVWVRSKNSNTCEDLAGRGGLVSRLRHRGAGVTAYSIGNSCQQKWWLVRKGKDGLAVC